MEQSDQDIQETSSLPISQLLSGGGEGEAVSNTERESQHEDQQESSTEDSSTEEQSISSFSSCATIGLVNSHTIIETKVMPVYEDKMVWFKQNSLNEFQKWYIENKQALERLIVIRKQDNQCVKKYQDILQRLIKVFNIHYTKAKAHIRKVLQEIDDGIDDQKRR